MKSNKKYFYRYFKLQLSSLKTNKAVYTIVIKIRKKQQLNDKFI